MQNNRNVYLVGSFIALVTVLTILLVFESDDDKISVDKDLFKVADLTKISRVALQHQDERIELKYNGIKWVVNDSLEADRQLIQVFFATLLQAEPKRPVAQRLYDSISQRISQRGIKVDLFESETIVKSFTVVGNERKTETYYQLQNDKQPYLMTIPGYKVYLAEIFELTSQDWRDKRIFNFNWQNFKSLKTRFPSEPAQDFSISFQNGFFGLDGIAKADTTKLNDYLDAVSLIHASRFITNSESPQYDSLFGTQPVYSIEVSDIANRSYRLDVFNAKVRNYVPALLNAKEGLLLDINEVQRIARKKGDFVK